MTDDELLALFRGYADKDCHRNLRFNYCRTVGELRELTDRNPARNWGDYSDAIYLPDEVVAAWPRLSFEARVLTLVMAADGNPGYG